MTMANEPDPAGRAPSPPRRRVVDATLDARMARLFPTAATIAATRRRRLLRLAIAVVVIGALGATGAAFALSDSTTPHYRTATAEARDVDAVLNGVAVIEPVTQATVAFPVAGVVAGVDVQVGATTTVGQRLATLDTTALERTLHERQAALAQAELVLATAADPPPAATDPPTDDAHTDTSAGASTDAVRRDAQQAVLRAQQEVDRTMGAADHALNAANAVCAAVGTAPTDPTTTVAPTTSTTSTTPPPTTSAAPTTSAPAGGSSGAAITACRRALTDVATAQTTVHDAQAALGTAVNGWNAAISERATAPSTSTPTTTTPAGSAGAAARTRTPSAADLVSYQKAVDAARAAIVVAEQAIAQTTIVSPIAGTVVAVHLQPGAAVSPGSTSATIVVQGPGGYEINTTVSVDEIAKVKLGQAATVQADGVDGAIEGQVVGVAPVPDSTSSATASYRVVIGMTGSNAAVGNGGTGSVRIVTQHASSTLTVPTSAVEAAAGRHTVTVLEGTTTRTVNVQVGVVGATWTQITNGLSGGEAVMIADPSRPLPGSATDTSTQAPTGPLVAGFGGFGGFGGPVAGGFGGGGAGARGVTPGGN
jgi:HlyD family secretion protein